MIAAKTAEPHAKLAGTIYTAAEQIVAADGNALPLLLDVRHASAVESAADWFAQHLPYTLSKYGMSMVTFGMAEEFRHDGIAFNSLWRKTTIATAAVEFALGGEALVRRSRRPEIMAEAAHSIFLRDARRFTGEISCYGPLLRQPGLPRPPTSPARTRCFNKGRGLNRSPYASCMIS